VLRLLRKCNWLFYSFVKQRTPPDNRAIQRVWRGVENTTWIGNGVPYSCERCLVLGSSVLL
jgi:hypothetical protein